MTATKIRPVQSTAPERIFLQGGPQLPSETEFGVLSEVTWCRDDVDGTGIPYVRADLAGAAPAAVAGPAGDWPDTCDGNEQEAFEAWAQRERHNMEQHPLHYLFLDAETNAARQGWKAGLLYAVEQMKTPAAPALEAPAAPMSTAEASAALAINSALHRIRAGNAAGAIEPLEQARAALAAAPQAPAAPVAFRQLLTGQVFRFKPDGPTFKRDKSFFETMPADHHERRSMPADMDALVYPVETQTAPVAAPAAPAVDASDDTALLDAMERERIAVIPEFEGPWDAQIFGEDEATLACGSGATPRKAIAEALASLEARKAKEGGA